MQGPCRISPYSQKKSLPLNQFGGKFLQPTTWRLIKPSTLSFSHMIYLLSHVTCLSNTSGWLHESPRNGLEEAFGGKIYPIIIQFFSTRLEPLQKCKIKDLLNPLRCCKVFYVDFCHMKGPWV